MAILGVESPCARKTHGLGVRVLRDFTKIITTHFAQLHLHEPPAYLLMSVTHHEKTQAIFFSLMQNNDRTHYSAEKEQIEKKNMSQDFDSFSCHLSMTVLDTRQNHNFPYSCLFLNYSLNILFSWSVPTAPEQKASPSV